MPEKVLVVDDEHDIADLLEVYLQNENYIVPRSLMIFTPLFQQKVIQRKYLWKMT